MGQPHRACRGRQHIGHQPLAALHRARRPGLEDRPCRLFHTHERLCPRQCNQVDVGHLDRPRQAGEQGAHDNTRQGGHHRHGLELRRLCRPRGPLCRHAARRRQDHGFECGGRVAQDGADRQKRQRVDSRLLRQLIARRAPLQRQRGHQRARRRPPRPAPSCRATAFIPLYCSSTTTDSTSRPRCGCRP